MKGPAVWPGCTSFRISLLMIEGLSLAERRLEYSLELRTLRKTSKESVNGHRGQGDHINRREV